MLKLWDRSSCIIMCLQSPLLQRERGKWLWRSSMKRERREGWESTALLLGKANHFPDINPFPLEIPLAFSAIAETLWHLTRWELTSTSHNINMMNFRTVKGLRGHAARCIEQTGHVIILWSTKQWGPLDRAMRCDFLSHGGHKPINRVRSTIWKCPQRRNFCQQTSQTFSPY